jgi:hypothetical protein
MAAKYRVNLVACCGGSADMAGVFVFRSLS